MVASAGMTAMPVGIGDRSTCWRDGRLIDLGGG
jgi:hypothetical protein